MGLINNWVKNQGINIHFIETSMETTNNEIPLVIIPGLSESAEDYIHIMEALLPRKCVAITLRGRGKSDAPQMGYTLEDHIGDIESVVNHLDLKEFILMGFSRGVSYALGFTFANLNLVKGLVLGDYPAFHSQLPIGWVEFFSGLPPWRGKELNERMTTNSLKALQNESRQVLFWDELTSIKFPVLIIRGGRQGAALSKEDGDRYIEMIPNSKLVLFDESNHNIFEPSLEKFIITIKDFFETVEG
jgi:pimeloyl-ACP methyl ester carboxylesterase